MKACVFSAIIVFSLLSACDTPKNPVYVGINCHVGKNVTLGPFVSLGNDDVCIGDNVKLEYTLVLDHSNIASNERISKSVI